MIKNLDERTVEVTEEIQYQWTLVRDCIAGEHRMKSKGEIYLPKKSGQSDRDYDAYKARAKWADYTEEALNTMHGKLFAKAPSVECGDNEILKKCLKNFDREGDTFFQFASDSVYDNMQTSFGGFIVDLPNVKDKALTKADALEAGLFPFARYYKAEDIMNWKFETINGVKKLSLVVLREMIETPVVDEVSSEFSHNLEYQYRILDFDNEGFYRVRIFTEYIAPETKDKIKVTEQIGNDIPVRVNGKRIRYIPFFFAPYKKLRKPMLYGIAELNKHYYMQSADYQNGVHYTTIPTGYATGHQNELDPKTKKPIPIRLGGDSWLTFPNSETKVGTLQFAGEGLSHCEIAIADTQEQIGILGTRSISPDKAMSETSEAAKIHREGENAKLIAYARDMSEVFTKVFQTIADWLEIEITVSIQINVDFDLTLSDPNMMNSIANLSRDGRYPLPLVYDALEKGELLPYGFTMKDYALLVDLEASGATSEEIIDVYMKLRTEQANKLIEVKKDESE